MSRVRIATLTGSLTDPAAFLVRLYSLMNPGVHTEIWIDDFVVLAGKEKIALDGTNMGCVRIWPLEKEQDALEWHVVDVPIRDVERAWQFIHSAVDARVPYGICVGECAFPKFVIDAFDADLDCCKPETWDHIFCSQLALLFLRLCVVQNILDVPDERSVLLWSVNSRGCLPSRLQTITDAVLLLPERPC